MPAIHGTGLQKLRKNLLTFRGIFALTTFVLAVFFFVLLVLQLRKDEAMDYEVLTYCWDLGISAAFMALLSIIAITKAVF